jgi:hypothetical protein
MRVEGVSTAPSAALRETERQVAVLKKAQDVSKTVGESLVRLVERSTPVAPGRRIDTYA